MIIVKKLCKTYGEKDGKIEALNHVNLEIEDGEFVAIMGASGSGKSTLLHLLGGLDRASGGRIEYDGKNIFEMNDRELSAFRLHNIGFVFQAYNLFPELTVYQNIMLPLRLGHRKDYENKGEKLMDKLGLKNRRNHLPQQLSGGQQQRVAIARAMIMNPKVILCDEPTGNLDKNSGEVVMNLLQDLNQKHGITIIMVTHDNELAEKTQRILRMSDGKIMV